MAWCGLVSHRLRNTDIVEGDRAGDGGAEGEFAWYLWGLESSRLHAVDSRAVDEEASHLVRSK